jgi:hypothetical protein
MKEMERLQPCINDLERRIGILQSVNPVLCTVQHVLSPLAKRADGCPYNYLPGGMQCVEPILENAIKTLQKIVDIRGMNYLTNWSLSSNTGYYRLQ